MTLVAAAVAGLVADVGARTRTGRGVEWRGRLAGQGAVLGRCQERVDARRRGGHEGGEFARVDGALAPGDGILLADAEVVGRADLPADADGLRHVVAVVFFAFQFVAGWGVWVGAAVAVGTGETDAECPLVADVFAGGFAVAEKGGYG